MRWAWRSVIESRLRATAVRPGAQSTLLTFAHDDATTDRLGRPGGIRSAGDDANPNGQMSAV